MFFDAFYELRNTNDATNQYLNVENLEIFVKTEVCNMTVNWSCAVVSIELQVVKYM